jgi:hypothetical protein
MKMLACQKLARNHKADFGNMTKPKLKLAEKRQKPILRNEKL